MDFNVHDTSGLWVGIVENPTSAIWTRRYGKPDDFELYFPASADMLALLTDDCYITRDDRPEVMLIEHIELLTDADEGNYILVKGRGAEALLERRIIWEQTAIKGRTDAAMYTLINQNAINPNIAARRLPITMQPPALPGFPITWEVGTITTDNGQDSASTTRFRGVDYIPIGKGLCISVAATQRIHLYYYDAALKYLGYSGWHAVTAYTITPSAYEGAAYVRVIVSNRDNTAINDLEAAAATVAVQHGINTQYTGNGLLVTIEEICAAYGLGFRAVANAEENIVPAIELLEGADRSERQSKNSIVEFSAEYENLLSSTYMMDTANYKNVALVAGEGEGKARKRSIYGSASGKLRRELYIDARDLSTNEGEISDAEYIAQLQARGAEQLSGHTITEAFDGEIDTSNNYILDEDYTLGDIVTIENEYGIRKNVRIASIMECWDTNGYTAIPTYENLEV